MKGLLGQPAFKCQLKKWLKKNTVKIKQYGNLDSELLDWNNRMYSRHPTPYHGVAGVIERARVRTVLNLAKVNCCDAVLEIGCEAGNLLASIHNAKRIVGVDICQIALEDAAKLFESRRRFAEFLQLDAQQSLPFSPGEFDVIICSEMLEHVHNPRAVLENIYSISTVNTRIVISIPIEATKNFIKKVLRTPGLLKVIFKGIEASQSEWHLHAFTKKKLNDISCNLFQVKRHKTVWAIHYVVHLLRK